MSSSPNSNEPNFEEPDDPHREVDEYGDDGRELRSHRVPPRVLFASYVMVGGAYVVVVTSILLSAIPISYFFFRDTFDLWGSAPEIVKAASIEDPTAVMPTGLFWVIWMIAGMVSYCAGWVVARFAAFAKLGHAVFLAVLLFVTYLQLAISAEPDLRWAPILLAGVCSIATAMGAKRQLRA